MFINLFCFLFFIFLSACFVVYFFFLLISVRECEAIEKHLELYDVVQHLSLNNAASCPRTG